jgi:hypothetical protein
MDEDDVGGECFAAGSMAATDRAGRRPGAGRRSEGLVPLLHGAPDAHDDPAIREVARHSAARRAIINPKAQITLDLEIFDDDPRTAALLREVKADSQRLAELWKAL